MANPKRRRTVEIYFVLYLAALVFLLPDKRDIDRYFLNNVGTPIFQPLFSLLPEKTTLTCRAIIDSTGPKILSLDSINTIFYSGDVEYVNFEFEIIDQTLRQSIKLTSNDRPSTKFFKSVSHPNQQAVSFQWSPPLFEKVSKTYLVRVIATARSKGNNPIFLGQKNTNGSPQTFQVKTQFSLLLIYLNSSTGLPMFPQGNQIVPMDTNSLLANAYRNMMTPQIPTGKVGLYVQNYEIKAIAYQQWSHVITAINVNLLKDLSVKEFIVTNIPEGNGGEASILDTQEDKFIIRGKTPSFGKTKVYIRIKRKYDGGEDSKTFVVSPLPYEQPDLDKFMYPDQTYNIDPKLPLIGRETRAFVKEGNTVRARSNQGEKFQFTPNMSDIGKTLNFERYIDTNLLGQPLAIKILNFPEPEILDIKERGQLELDIQTRAFGFHNRERNEIVRFEVQGNARYQDLRGRISDLNDVRLQHFLFTPANPKKPFEFTITAFDKRGRKSYQKSYKKD